MMELEYADTTVYAAIGQLQRRSSLPKDESSHESANDTRNGS
jgi:hypothetical protein